MNGKPRTLLWFALLIGATLFGIGALALQRFDFFSAETPGPGPRPDKANDETAAENWYSLRNADGIAFVTLRQAGIDHLIIYAGVGADGAAELKAVTADLRKGGFDLLTHRPASEAFAADAQLEATAAPKTRETSEEKHAAEEASGRIEFDDDRLREFLELATSRPGYRKRVLIVHGRRLLPGLEFLASAPRSVANLIVLRPGDALRDRTKIIAAARELPADLRVFWVSSNQGREAAGARVLRDALDRAKIAPQIVRMKLPGLVYSRRRTPEFRLRLNESLYYELLMERIALNWSPATQVFAGGCGYVPRGPRDFYLGATEVSGLRDRDFCPLFLRRAGRTLYHADEVTEEFCAYRVADGRTRLYCAYDS